MTVHQSGSNPLRRLIKIEEYYEEVVIKRESSMKTRRSVFRILRLNLKLLTFGEADGERDGGTLQSSKFCGVPIIHHQR